jgi:chromosome segregation ATPase
MSPAPVVPLEDLARRIAQQQAELEALRKEYEARQAQLADLSTRKQQLEDQLSQVEAEIRAISQGAAPTTPQSLTNRKSAPQPRTAATRKGPGKAARRARVNTGGKRKQQPPLRAVLTELLQQARQPLTGRELAEQVAATGYQTNSKSLKDNVWALLVKMDNVEHLPGKGYRLKKKP